MNARYRVPDELKETLTDFTIAYLLERPDNLQEFGLKFFRSLKNNSSVHSSDPNHNNDKYDELDDEKEAARARALQRRRKSVFGEGYDPTKDKDEPLVVHPKSESQRSRLAEAVKNILLFRSLDAKQMNEVLDAMFERKVIKGEYVIKQGDDGDNFYAIEKGQYKAYVKYDEEPEPKMVMKYNNSGIFGELALMYNMPRAASVQACTEGSLWAMDRKTFRRIVLKNAYEKRQMYESLIESVPMLSTLENYERMNLADALVPRSFPDGEAIIRQGAKADGMYFIEDGTVRYVKAAANGTEKEVKVKRDSKGAYFGELGLIAHKPRAVTVYSVGTVKLAFLDVEAFERLLGPCMEIMKRNAEEYEEQLLKLFGSKTNITGIR